MIRPEFFKRNDLTPVQRAFLDFAQAYLFTLQSTIGSLETDEPSAAQQQAHRVSVLDELAENSLTALPRTQRELTQLIDFLSLARRASASLRGFCVAASAPLTGLEGGRAFLASLCACVADTLDWSHKRRILGSTHDGAEKKDLDISLSEIAETLAAERDPDRVQACLDFRDALKAADALFSINEDIEAFSQELFPIHEDKYWKRP